MDWAYYNAAEIGAVRREGARFPVTAIPEDAWTVIKYPRVIWDDQLAHRPPTPRPAAGLRLGRNGA